MIVEASALIILQIVLGGLDLVSLMFQSGEEFVEDRRLALNCHIHRDAITTRMIGFNCSKLLAFSMLDTFQKSVF